MAQAPLIPFDYLERQKRRTSQQSEVENPIAKAMGVLQTEQARSTIIQAPDPDTTAKVTRVARETGEPPALIEDRLGDVEKAQRADKMGALLDMFPVYRLWAQDDPRGVVAASDDHKALGILGGAWEWAKAKLPGTAKAAGYRFAQTGAQTNAVLSDYINGAYDFLTSIASPNTQTVGQLQERQAARKAYWNAGVSVQATAAQQARPAYSGWLEENVLQGIEQTPASMFAVVAGAATRSPALTMTLMGAQTGFPAVYEARQKGIDPVRSLNYGLGQAWVEVITEKLPATELLNAIAKKTPFGRALMVQLTSEIPQEQIATVLQDFNEWAVLNPDKPYSAYVAERPEAALSTLVQTAVGTTVQTAVAKAASSSIDAGAKVAGRLVQAEQAKDETNFFDQVERAAQESKLRGRDPEVYAELVGRTANDAGVSQVFVPAEAIRAYQQSDSYDQFDDPFADYQAQIDEAEAVGGDVVLPASFALGTLPGTAAWTSIKADLRLAPGGMSAREAESLQSELDDVMAELTDQAMQRDRAQQGEATARDQIVQRVTSMLQNAGFTPANAAMQAELIAQREATRAARMGRELTGNEFTTQIAQVLPEKLGEVVKADQLDLVVNAMRKGGPAVRQRGKSLLEWIASRGGIEDRGGDIASMGGDKWHKGKVGKRKLLKPFDAAQGNMLGGATSDNSVERLLDAAISEGYFPDLYALRESGQSIDNNVLLEAIGQELSGSPLYAQEAVTDNVRAAADDLSQMLAERGLSASEMTDAEIRDAVAQMGEQSTDNGTVYDQLPETIDIGGVARPTRNSEGMPLARSEEGLRAFYAWFGNSAVVDEEGRPLVVYHGTRKGGFDRFRTDGNGKTADAGAFFTTSVMGASTYSNTKSIIDAPPSPTEIAANPEAFGWKVEEDDGGWSVTNSEGWVTWSSDREQAFVEAVADMSAAQEGNYAVYLSIQEPSVEDFEGANWDSRGAREWFVQSEDGEISEYFTNESEKDDFVDNYDEEDHGPLDVSEGLGNPDAESTDDLARLAKANGYDGVIFENITDEGPYGQGYGWDDKVFVAFSPTQIKSINNRGSFDPSDARILYQSGDNASIALNALAREGNDKAIIAQALVNGLGLSVEQLSNILVGVASASETDSLSGIETLAPMLSLMRRIVLHEGKVLDAIIKSVPVNVVNNLGRSKRSAKVALHDEAMLKDGSAFDAELPISMMSDRASAVRFFVRETARVAAEGLGEIVNSRRELLKGNTAIGARELGQDMSSKPRARILLPGGDLSTFRIELFESRNLSSLLHELSHQWLEELRADAQSPDAPEQVKADWQAVQDWFAANGHAIADGVIPVEAHEMWARGGERYLMEGKAPSSALQRLFETFRGWLLSVYKTVDALRAPITPEIREVLDRLLATDEEIAAMAEMQALQPMFKDAVAIGMTGEEFNAYTAQAQAARDQANATLLQKTMAAIRRRETKKFNDERNAVKADEAERLDNEPLLKSIRLMRETPIDLEWLVDRMGQDVLDLLPKRVPPLWREGGTNPDTLAELAGFGSGQQMIEVLIGAERQHRQEREGGDQRTMRARMIDNAADAEMTRRYGDDPLNDGSIEQEAIAAVNGELQGELLASEVRLLSRRTGGRPTPYKIARQWARNRVRTGLVSVEASPGAIQRHARNVAKAGRDAEKAMLAGKMDEALRFKQQQMLSSALLAEAKAAHDEVQDAVKRMGKIAKRATMKSVDQDYLEQAHALLEAVDLKERTQKSIERQGRWEAWAAAREAEGYEIVVPASFEATIGRTNWSRLSVENLLGLDEAVKQVMHLGRLKQSLLDKAEQREWDEIFREAENAGGNIDGPPPKDMTDPGWWDALKGRVIGADAALLKMETVFDWLDGGNSEGVFNRIAFRPIAEAQAREQDMLKDYYARIKALFEAVPSEVAARWQDKLQLPFIDPLTGEAMRMNRHKVIAMALNVGNEGNLQRLSDGYQINPDAITEYLNATLTAEEWQFVQGVWDTIDTLWPEIARIEREVNGVAPDKVEAREVQTPSGTIRGGYYPAVYDGSRDYKAEENRGKEADLFEGGYTRATTRASSTKERAEKVSRPILLDLGIINRHLGEVIHDITHREAVIRANRFLTSERVRRAVDQALGPEISKQFRPWLKFVANSWAIERAGNEGFGKFIGQLRANATVVGMGLRATTMVTQISGYSNSIEVVGEAAMAKALAQFSQNPAAAIRWVMEASDEVRNRMDTLDRDIRTELARLNAVTPVSKVMRSVIDAKRFVFHGIGYMDRLVSVPTWIAGYNNALAAGMDEQDARYAGDKAVRQSQGAGGPKDLAAIQRGTGKWGEALKLFTMFYSYFSAQYQRQRTLGRDVAGVDQRKPRSAPKLAARAFFLIALPPLLTEVLRGAVGAPSGPGDDEWWAQWTLRKLLANALGPIPMVRDVFEPTWNAVVGNKVFNPSISPLQRAMDGVVKVGRDVGKLASGDETKSATKDVLELVGYSTGLVPGQVASATQFLVDVGSGEADPQGFSDWLEGLSTGKIKED